MSADELVRLEREVEQKERELEREVGAIEEDLRAVAAELREVRLRLEEERSRGAVGVDDTLARLAGASVPSGVPLDGHAARVAEVRREHARARLWLVSALRDELERVLLGLSPAIQLVEEGRHLLSRLAAQPRVNLRPRDQYARVKSLTEELAKTTRDDAKAARRRQQPRQRFEAAVDLHSRSNFYTGVTENISEGGLFIATEERLPIGTPVDLAFSLPSGEDLRLKGVVRWTRETAGGLAGGLGIGFEELTEEAYLAVRTFLESRAPIVREP